MKLARTPMALIGHRRSLPGKTSISAYLDCPSLFSMYENSPYTWYEISSKGFCICMSRRGTCPCLSPLQPLHNLPAQLRWCPLLSATPDTEWTGRSSCSWTRKSLKSKHAVFKVAEIPVLPLWGLLYMPRAGDRDERAVDVHWVYTRGPGHCIMLH